jgi:hypothetical protein
MSESKMSDDPSPASIPPVVAPSKSPKKAQSLADQALPVNLAIEENKRREQEAVLREKALQEAALRMLDPESPFAKDANFLSATHEQKVKALDDVYRKLRRFMAQLPHVDCVAYTEVLVKDILQRQPKSTDAVLAFDYLRQLKELDGTALTPHVTVFNYLSRCVAAYIEAASKRDGEEEQRATAFELFQFLAQSYITLATHVSAMNSLMATINDDTRIPKEMRDIVNIHFLTKRPVYTYIKLNQLSPPLVKFEHELKPRDKSIRFVADALASDVRARVRLIDERKSEQPAATAATAAAAEPVVTAALTTASSMPAQKQPAQPTSNSAVVDLMSLSVIPQPST